MKKNPLTIIKFKCIMISAKEASTININALLPVLLIQLLKIERAEIKRIGELYMFVKEVMVKNQVGLHARPATFFIQKANEFKSSIWIEKEERRVNAKSLLGILSLGIVGGTTVKVIADGADEKAAVDALIELVDSGFSEESR